MKIIALFLNLSLIPFFCKALPLERFDVPKIISSADVVRTSYGNEATINLYQGNGLFGCTYGLLGLHATPDKEKTLGKFGPTYFMHLEHRGRGKFGSDFLLPMAKIYWEKDFPEIADFKQKQSFYDGTITTSFKSSGDLVKIKTWFDPVEKGLSGISIYVNATVPNVIFDPCRDFNIHYNQNIIQTVDFKKTDEGWKIDITGLGKTTSLYVMTNASVQLINNMLCMKLNKGDNEIIISVNAPTKASLKKSLDQTIKWWNRKWNESGCIKFPDLNAQKMWVRSMAMFLSSYGDDKKGLAPPMGFTGNGWPFNFPQDLSYVHPMLLSTGNTNIAKSWIEYFAERIPGMKEYTRRLLHSDGILCPWVFPYGKFEGYHDPSPPNIFYYEIHNSAYLSRMASETAVFLNDSVWSSKYAIPLIKETAEFYRSICQKELDGLWHLFVKPGMGQDEMGGFDQKDYLCALYGAQYCFQQAIAYHLDDNGTYGKILKDGLAFNLLKSKKGFYYTSGGSGEKDFGKQKHPVQLNELAFLPVNKKPSDPASIAYQLRYEITLNSKKPFFAGWTLGEFLLAGSRYGNRDEWIKDWDNLLKSDNIDPDWIQIYESSGAKGNSFYNTTNGLIAQSLLNNVVCDWYGKLEIAKCFPWQDAVLIKDISSILGVKISGKITDKSASLRLAAWKDCRFFMAEKDVKLKKGEVKSFNIDL